MAENAVNSVDILMSPIKKILPGDGDPWYACQYEYNKYITS